MYVSDQFVDGKWQLTDYRDCIQRWGFGGDKIKTTKNDLKLHKKWQNLVAPLANEAQTKESVRNFLKLNKQQWQ